MCVKPPHVLRLSQISSLHALVALFFEYSRDRMFDLSCF
jgi:hypothetical protein